MVCAKQDIAKPGARVIVPVPVMKRLNTYHANKFCPENILQEQSHLDPRCSFYSLLNSSVMLGNYFQQTAFSDYFFLGALGLN